MIRHCKLCTKEIPAGRIKALPTATTCVSCSTTGRKKGVPRLVGRGDHTSIELELLDEKEYKAYEKIRDKPTR